MHPPPTEELISSQAGLDAVASFKSVATSQHVLSEAWSVEAKHEGCYTGGKVSWSEAAGELACLCNEELHLVSVKGGNGRPRRVSHEADPVLTYALDPSGQNVCTSHRSGLMRHFRIGQTADDKPSLERSWRAHDTIVADVCFDATGSFVATGSVDKSAKVWDFNGYFCTHNFRAHSAMVSLVRFHPSRLQLVTVADVEARLWDLQTSSLLGVMKDHLTAITSISFGKVSTGVYELCTGGRDQVVNVWKLEDKPALVRSIPVFENVAGVAVVPTSGLLKQSDNDQQPLAKWLRGQSKPPAYVVLTVGDKCQLRVWSPSDGKCIASFQSPHAAKGVFRQVLAMDQAGSQIVTIGEDMNLVIWSVPEFKVKSYIMGHNEDIVHVQMLPKLDWQVNAEDGGEAKSESKKSWSVSAERFVCITNDEHPRVVSCTGFSASLLRGHSDMVLSCDVSVDGKWIATGSKDQSIRVWNAETHKTACVISGHVGPVSALSFPKKLPKGPKALAATCNQPLVLISGSQDKTVKAWELASPLKLADASSPSSSEQTNCLQVTKSSSAVIAHEKDVNDVTVAPNNKCLASAGQDKLVRIWSYPDLQLLGECKGHSRAVWCVAFSPTDQVIASASGDSTVRLWNLRDYTPIRSFQGHSGAVLRVSFLSNGMQLMSSASDGLLKLWQIRTADCAATMDEHTGKVWCIDVVGDRMVSGCSESKLCVWRDSTAEQVQERQDAKAELQMKDTKIGLLVQEGRIEEALSLALDLDRPGQMRQILCNFVMDDISRVLEETDGGADSQPSAEDKKAVEVDLKRWVAALGDAQLEKLVVVLEQWNSNRKMASMAQMFIQLLLEVVPPERFMAIEGMNATCQGLLSYLSRHHARTESLLQKTFVLDLILQSSGMGLALMDEFHGKKDVAEIKTDDETMEIDDEKMMMPAGHDPSVVAKVEKLKKSTAEGALSKTMEVLYGKDGAAGRLDEADRESSDDDDKSDDDERGGDAAGPVEVSGGVPSADVKSDDKEDASLKDDGKLEEHVKSFEERRRPAAGSIDPVPKGSRKKRRKSTATA